MVDYVYAALLLNSAGKPVDEAGITKIVEAAGVAPDDVRIKALVAALDGVDITKVLSQAAAMPVAVAAVPAGATAAAPAEANEEKKEQEEEAGIEGLGALFG